MRYLAYSLLIAIALAATPVQADSNWGPVGVRGGFGADNKDEGATQYEMFGLYQLPWSLRTKSGWGVATKVEATAGVLRNRREYGFVGSIGPSLGLGNPTFPLEIDLGISVALLNRERFGDRDYNGIEQFISHGGVVYRVSPHLGLSYRFQHMSNAGFNGSPNPGLNLHLFGASWYFTD